MEWNAKWDWENLDIFSSKAIVSPKKLEAADWGIVEGEEDIDAGGSFNLSGGFGGTSRSASDIGNNSSAKSSLSASTESSFKECLKTSNFTFDGFGGFPGDFSSKKNLGRGEINGDSPPLEPSVGSGEPFIGLKLGKRTYFENGCAKSSSKGSSFSDVPVSSMATAKKVKSSCQMGLTPRCQVEGCNLDLSSAKDYHRKHRVCGNHSRCPLVVIGGLERRFCQQCSRFHSLSEFDEQKRSCRRRLSDHNARRRKPQQETIQFNSSSLSSSFYDGQHQLSFVLNNVPAIQTRPAANSTWDGTFSSKYLPAKPKAEKEGESIDGQPHFLGTQLPHSASMPSHAFSRLLPSKGSRLEVLNQGLKESMASSDVEAALDYRRALSLLSNNSWASCESDLNPIDHPMNGNQTISIPQSGIQTFPPQGLPLSSSHYWQVDQQSNDPHMVTVAAKTSTANTHYQGPYETRFYSHHSMN